MKRSFWIFLFIFLQFTCIAFANTDELTVDGEFTAITAQGNTVYLLDKEGHLFTVQAGQAFPEAPACTLPRDADFLLTDQGVLYGLEALSGTLFRIDPAMGAVSAERTVEITDEIELKDGHSEYTCSAAALQGGTLTMLWEHERYNEPIIDQVAPDGTHTTYDVGGDSTLLFAEPDGRIVVVPDWCGQVALCVLDGKGESTYIRDLPYDTWGIALHGKTLYIGTGNYIKQYASPDAPDGHVAACLPQAPISMGTQSMHILDGGWVALLNRGTFHLRRLDITQSTRTLTLSPELYDAPETNAAFLAEHPGVALHFADWWMDSPSTAEDYQQAIANLEADILDCSLEYSPWQALKNEGYAADLSTSALIQQNVADMYPAFRDACMREGKAVGIPLGCETAYAPKIDKQALLDKTGLAEEQLPKTFLDLPLFFADWVERSASATPSNASWDKSAAHTLCGMFIEQYVSYYESRGESLVFDTPLFRAGLALRDKVPKLPSVVDARTWREEGPWYGVMGHISGTLPADRAPDMLPLPLDAEHPYTLPVALKLLFVNPNSPNIDLAIAYLKSAVCTMPPEKQVLWTPRDGQPTPNPDYEMTLAAYAGEIDRLRAKATALADDDYSWLDDELLALQADAAEFTQHGRWLVSPSFLQGYGYLSGHLHVFEQGIFSWSQRRAASDLCEQYMNDHISADALIVELQRIADTL